MTHSLSERALREITRRLGRIRVADGYTCDAGLRVFRARRKVDPDVLPALVVWDQGEQIANGGGESDAYDVTLSVSVDVLVACDQDDTGEAMECAKADVKRAVLSGGKGALFDRPPPDKSGQIGTIRITGCTPSAREDGATSESMAVNFEIRFREGYGNPYSDQLERR